MDPFELDTEQRRRYGFEEIEPGMAEDLMRAFGANNDPDDEIDIPGGVLDDEAIARLDEVFRQAEELRRQRRSRPSRARPGRSMRVGELKAIDFEAGEWVVKDVDTRREYRLAKERIPQRLWDSVDEGDLLDFSIEGGQAASARRHDPCA
jgi:hypothetical protein